MPECLAEAAARKCILLSPAARCSGELLSVADCVILSKYSSFSSVIIRDEASAVGRCPKPASIFSITQRRSGIHIRRVPRRFKLRRPHGCVEGAPGSSQELQPTRREKHRLVDCR